MLSLTLPLFSHITFNSLTKSVSFVLKMYSLIHMSATITMSYLITYTLLNIPLLLSCDPSHMFIFSCSPPATSQPVPAMIQSPYHGPQRPAFSNLSPHLDTLRFPSILSTVHSLISRLLWWLRQCAPPAVQKLLATRGLLLDQEDPQKEWQPTPVICSENLWTEISGRLCP